MPAASRIPTSDEQLQADFDKLIHGGIFNPYTGEVTPLPHELIPPAKFVPVSTGQTPLVVDLTTLSGKTFQEIVAAFNQQTLDLGELPPFELPNGWYCLGPALQEYFLRRHRPDSNRDPGLGTVQYYGRQMGKDDWKPTGESIIFNQEGLGTNGQHREWAGLLGRHKFVSYVVADAPPLANAFAYLDNVKARNQAEALKTARLNGTASLLARLVNIIVNYEAGVFTCAKKKRSERLSPHDVLTFVNKNPLTRRAAHLTASEYKGACTAVGHDEVVAFMSFKLLSLFGDETSDQFMEDVELDNELAPDLDAGRAIRTFLARQRKTADPLPKHMILAHLIKGFNLWIEGTPVKRVTVASDDDFPTFVIPENVQQPDPEPETEPATA